MFSLQQSYNFSFPTDIRFGVGVRREIPNALKQNSLKRPLVVTDQGLREHVMVRTLFDSLVTSGFSPALFADFSGNPIERHVDFGSKAYLSHSADSIVVVGGGAALDVAKAIALMSCHDGSILDFCEDAPNPRSISHSLPFVIAVPTTSGTGSEVGRSTVISNEKTHEKKVVFHPRLLPSLVIADPELTLDMPANVTSSTGMDALSHLLESYLAKDFHPICDAIALHGLTLLNKSIRQCYRIALDKGPRSEENLIARGNMMLAAMMGAIAFQKGLGVTHSCAHALSSVCNTHHGLANGVMLPFAMGFNAQRAPTRFAQIAQALTLKENSAAAVVDWIKQLQIDIDIPKRLSEIGVETNHLDFLTNFAVKDGCHLSNPTPVSRTDFFQIFESAL